MKPESFMHSNFRIDRSNAPCLFKNMTIKKTLLIFLSGFLLAACAGAPFPAQSEYTIYLVRHAEKDPGLDPGLTPEGKLRAKALAETLSENRLEAIYSTKTERTRQTAAPTALNTGLPVIYYDPQDLTAFATQIVGEARNTLIVGHSNTTPDLVASLGGTPGLPIVEATEYDRLYVLTLTDETVTTDLRRYGAPSPD